MPSPTPPTHRRRRPPFRAVSAPATAIVAMVLTAIVAGGCATVSARPATTVPAAGPEAGVTSRYGADVAGSHLPTTAASAAATRDFAVDVDDATAAFVASVGELQTDVTAGRTAAARADELAAQTDYDAFRALESGNPVNASTLDELASDVAPDQSFGGLHAIERDLWASGPLTADVTALAGQAPVAQFLLSRERLGPEAIGTLAVDQLDWVVDVALPVSQEQFSHLGLVDVAATEQAADRSFTAIEPLGRLVAPTLTSTLVGQFDALSGDVDALGPPTTVPDTAVTPAARLALSQELDATATTLARLAAVLTPYGTEGPPS